MGSTPCSWLVNVTGWSRDSSVGIATGYGLYCRGSNTGKENYSLFSTQSRLGLGPTKPPIQCVPEEISLGVKQPERGTNNSHPSSVKIKNDGAILPFPHTSSWHSA
jgi:hypothetical protein